MKRIFTMVLIILISVSVCACSKEDSPAVSTEPGTTSTTIPTTGPVNPYTKFKVVMSAYNEYAQNASTPLPIDQVIFKDGDGCYITPIEDRIFTFFTEGAIEENKIYTSGDFVLYRATDMAGIMLQAMNNAWNTYASKCAQEHVAISELTNYLFKCDYFEGVYGIDQNGRLVQNLKLEGTDCGQFGAFTIYLPQASNDSAGGIMNDADRMVQIRNIYTKFVTDAALDGQSYESIENYIFEYNGNYYRILDWIESAIESDADELATIKDYEGWHIYHAIKEDTLPSLDGLKASYADFVANAAVNNREYLELIEYIYFDGQTYYAIDEWLNVYSIEEELVGLSADTEEYQGFTLYLFK